MNNGTIHINHWFFLAILCLSSTVLYAEVLGVNEQDVTAAQKTSPKVPLEKVNKKTKKGTWQLQAEQWELARSGETILSLPIINKVIKTWLSKKNKKIEIQYPGGEDGELWVQELTDWLVALGVPSKNMSTTPGSGADDVIRFNIINSI